MKILIVGNGGREHALLWRLALDRPEASFLITRGTPGTDKLARSIDISPTDVAAVVAAAGEYGVDLTVIGPESPLAAGLADRLGERGLAAFGPGLQASRIESSKVFSKQLMKEIGVPTAAFETFTELEQALDYVEAGPEACVVKADGLAGGKGSIVCRSKDEARRALRLIMQEEAFGPAGANVVIEEFLEGEELSVLALVDGRNVVPLVPSQDHKAVGKGDTGPNTGGMGAYAPVTIAGEELVDRVVRTIMEPVTAELARRGYPYRGCFYAGLMVTADGPKVVEFNCRFGDPESQVVLPLLDCDLVSLMQEASVGSLAGVRVPTRPGAAVCVVLASGGYPGEYEKGKNITFRADLDKREDVIVFHAGTKREGSNVVTSGGRVLGVTGLGRDVARAAKAAYSAVRDISFAGMYCRTDIAYREIIRLKAIQDGESN
ncbi:MAG TPA: phosphoribosylamine--glycine ligase [archaeon]|nr:phosphoribosylamine--glycine ligase [archaeon]